MLREVTVELFRPLFRNLHCQSRILVPRSHPRMCQQLRGFVINIVNINKRNRNQRRSLSPDLRGNIRILISRFFLPASSHLTLCIQIQRLMSNNGEKFIKKIPNGKCCFTLLLTISSNANKQLIVNVNVALIKCKQLANCKQILINVNK